MGVGAGFGVGVGVVGEEDLIMEDEGMVGELYFEGLAYDVVVALGWIID